MLARLCSFLEAPQGRIHFLAFPASRSHLRSLAYGPLSPSSNLAVMGQVLLVSHCSGACPHYSLFPIFLFNCLCYFFPKFHLIWPHSSGNKVYRIDCNFPGQILSHLNVNSHVFPNVDAKIDYNGKPHKGTQISCFRDKLESFQETGSVSCFLALAI